MYIVKQILDLLDILIYRERGMVPLEQMNFLILLLKLSIYGNLIAI
jgi:hypothetical protein